MHCEHTRTSIQAPCRASTTFVCWLKSGLHSRRRVSGQGENMQNMHQTTQECRLQGTSAHLTRFCSRKRPFVALSQTQCCNARDPRRASSESRPSVSRSARELQAGPLRAATLGTAEAASDSIEATNVRPEALSQSDQRQRFDWHNQWYAIGYERWASQELNTNCVVMECQQHDMSLTL